MEPPTFVSHALPAPTRQLVMSPVFHAKMDITRQPSPRHAWHVLPVTTQLKGLRAFSAHPEASPPVLGAEAVPHVQSDHSLHLVHQLAAPVQPDSLSCRSVYHRVLHRVV